MTIQKIRQRGLSFERRVAKMLSEDLSLNVQRARQEGVRDDIGDLVGLPGWCVQCGHTSTYGSAYSMIVKKVQESEIQRVNLAAFLGSPVPWSVAIIGVANRKGPLFCWRTRPTDNQERYSSEPRYEGVSIEPILITRQNATAMKGVRDPPAGVIEVRPHKARPAFTIIVASAATFYRLFRFTQL